VSGTKPRFSIRRFDVFADYHRTRNEAHGMTEDVAKGRGIWAAKVVAGRRSGGGAAPPPSGKGAGKDGHSREEERDDEYRSVGGEVQTGETFDREIIERMGRQFYDEVFHPAIVQAVDEGKRYEDIRDSIRKDWKG
jgi:hypothetical protein